MTRPTAPRVLPKGIAAVPLVLVMLASLALLIGAVGKLALQRTAQTASEGYDKRARYAAYAGCQYGLLSLGSNVSWAPDEPVVLPLPNDPQTFFQLEVYNNYDGSLGASYVAPDGTEVKEGFAFLRSRGTSVRGATSYNTAVSGLAVRGDRFFNHAAVGHESVILRGGSMTDAFTSFHRVGSVPVYHHYGRQDPSGLGPDPNPNSIPGTPSGNVVSNATVNAIRVEGGSTVNGRAISGPLSDPGAAISQDPPGSITEAVEAGTTLKRIPRNRPPLNPDEATNPANIGAGATVTLEPGAYTNLNVGTGGTVQLEPGEIYMFTGDVNINAGNLVVNHTGELADSPPAFVYFGGLANITDNSRLNEDGIPHRLQMYAMGNGQDGYETEFHLHSGSQMWGIISGRTLEADINNAELFGALKGIRVEVTSGQIHYDRVLYNEAQGGLSAWKLLGVVETDMVDGTDVVGDGGAAAAAGGGGGDAAAAAAAAAAAGAAGGDAAGGGFGGGDAAAAAAGGDAAGGDAASGGDAGGDAAAGDAAAGAGGGGPVGGAVGDAAAAAAGGDAAGGDAGGDAGDAFGGDGDGVGF